MMSSSVPIYDQPGEALSVYCDCTSLSQLECVATRGVLTIVNIFHLCSTMLLFFGHGVSGSMYTSGGHGYPPVMGGGSDYASGSGEVYKFHSFLLSPTTLSSFDLVLFYLTSCSSEEALIVRPYMKADQDPVMVLVLTIKLLFSILNRSCKRFFSERR